jgi:DNA-directed RNA polymerase subunit RPC12/RpoP
MGVDLYTMQECSISDLGLYFSCPLCRRKALTKERSSMQSATFLATKLGVHCLQSLTVIMPM